MQLINTILDSLYYGIIQPVFLGMGAVLDRIFLETLSFLNVSYAGQVAIVAICTVLFAFGLRSLLKVESKEKIFQKRFLAQKAERDTIGIVSEYKKRDALYTSVDQSIDEEFNTYLAQHYFRYVLIYLLPLFLVMAWLNSSLDEHVLPSISGQVYLFFLPSQPLGMQGVSVTLLFLLVYVISLIVGFQIMKRFRKKQLGVEEGIWRTEKTEAC